MRRAKTIWILTFVFYGSLGAGGAYAYLNGSYLYRGFAPPTGPTTIAVPGHPGRTVPVVAGTLQTIQVTSAALGGLPETVYVWLPPGYASDTTTRYPTLYLLHGTPGRPDGFIRIGRVGLLEAQGIVTHRMVPSIIVMPSGAPSQFSDTEWANGVGANTGWETYLSHDVVGTVDRMFRTIPSANARAIGGLSEGAYGAVNIALHHPGEFGFVESWSGYETAAHIPSIFGTSAATIAYNSPMAYLRTAATSLRRHQVRFWMYSAAQEKLLPQNQAFAAALQRFGIPHTFFVVPGEHNWATWRAHMPRSLTAVSRFFAHGHQH